MKYRTPYKLLVPRFGNPAGTIVYHATGCDYGCSSDDSRYTGIQHVSVTLKENGDYPFFTVAERDLEEMAPVVVATEEEEKIVIELTAQGARNIVNGGEAANAKAQLEKMINHTVGSIEKNAKEGKRSVSVYFDYIPLVVGALVKEFLAVGYNVEQVNTYDRSAGINAKANGATPNGFRVDVSW